MNLREWALPVYTILIQLSTGALLALWLVRWRFARLGGKDLDRLTRIPVLILLSTIGVAAMGAHFHLSRPFQSFLAVSNFATSWLSREILCTVLFLLGAGILTYMVWLVDGRRRLKTAFGWLTIGLGVSTVYAMAHVYLLPTQVAWDSTLTVFAYFAESALLGTISLAVILLMDLNFSYEKDSNGIEARDHLVALSLEGLAVIAPIALVANLALNVQQIAVLGSLHSASAGMSMRLLSDLYEPLYLVRLALAVTGVGWFVVSYIRTVRSGARIREMISPAYVACILVLVGEILGRFLFYAVHVRSGI
jgi:anaerobic dimethyl sulfoxide reductase subunit C (anchor subunit)